MVGFIRRYFIWGFIGGVFFVVVGVGIIRARELQVPRDIHCKAVAHTGGVRFDPVCLQEDILPVLGPKRTLDVLGNHIVAIGSPYDEERAQFTFTGSYFVLSGVVPYQSYKQRAMRVKSLDVYPIIGSRKIFVPWATLAQRELSDYHLVAAHRDISEYGACATVNFSVGMDVLSGGVTLRSGAARNANTYFSNLSGYCTGASDQVYKFYQGICGVTSMIFRASMLEPRIAITKRYGHTNRYTRYYGDIVRGDDAAIYEDIKQFEIQNISPYQIVLKSLRVDKQPFVVLVTDRPNNAPVILQKNSLSELSAEIVRTWNGVTHKRKSVYDQKVSRAN